MQKALKRILSFILVLCLTTFAFAKEGDGYVYGGLSTFPLRTTGLTSIEISDFQYFPSAEGRIILDLTKGSVDTNNLYGGVIGYEGNLSNLISFVAEAQVGYTGILAINGQVGLALRIPLGPLSIGGVAKGGYLYGSITFDDVKQKTGYQNPVILTGENNGTIYDGYKVTASMGGFSYQAGLIAQLDLDSFSLYGESGYSQALVGDLKIIYKDPNNKDDTGKEIPLTSNAIKVPGSYTHAVLDPKISSLGYYVNIGLKFKL